MPNPACNATFPDHCGVCRASPDLMRTAPESAVHAQRANRCRSSRVSVIIADLGTVANKKLNIIYILTTLIGGRYTAIMQTFAVGLLIIVAIAAFGPRSIPDMRRDALTDRIDSDVARVLAALPADVARRERRFILGIAGPPASGKSTLAVALRDALDATAAASKACGIAAIAALDAFHYDDRVLHARGHRLRKGAPFTFDAEGFEAMLARLAASPREAVAVPVFDRDLELSRAAAVIVEPHHRVVITEGNYLLLDDERWRGARALIDFTVFLDVRADELHDRLVRRWRGHGYGPAQAKEKTQANDLVNARLVADRSVQPDLRIGP